MLVGNDKKTIIPEKTGYFLLVVGLAVHVYLALHYDFTQDDAFISFRYAANFLNGHGLVYNIGERVEGFTNFMWTIVMIMGRLAGVDFIQFSKILGMASGTATIATGFLLAKRIFNYLPPGRRLFLAGICSILSGMVYSLAYWAVAGLETAAFAFTVIMSLYLYLRRSRLTPASLILSTLLRPEGALVFAFILAYEIISRRKFNFYVRWLIIGYAVMLIPYAAFKIAWYGSLFPNPFFAKTGFNPGQIIQGLEYSGVFFGHYLGYGLFLLPAVICIRRMPPALRMVACFSVVYTLYIILIGGDVLKVHRFFVPLFPLYFILIVYGLQKLLTRRILFIFGIMIIVAWQMIVPRNYVATFHGHETSLTSKMNHLADWLLTTDNSDFSVAASTIGMIGYRLTGHTVIDLLGLTDSTIARHPEPPIEGLQSTWRESKYNSPYVLARQPDYIIFSTSAKPSAPAERALFLYSRFLQSYRTVGFYIGASLQSVYRRYRPIAGPVERDVDYRLGHYFNRGLNLLGNDRDYPGAIAAFDTALMYSPRPEYPYLYYGKMLAYRDSGDFEEAYRLLYKIIELDTLVFEAYMNLYLLEAGMKREDAARYYRARTAELAPWYMPRLDSIVAKTYQR